MEELNGLQQKVASAWELLKLDVVAEQITALEAQTTAAGFWDNPQQAQKITKQLADLQKDYEQWRKLRDDVAASLEMTADAKELGDPELMNDVARTAASLQKQFAQMEEFVLLAGEHDTRDAYVSFHAGAGGVDAQDWAEMLYRMIVKYCELNEWGVEVVDESKGGEAGLKSATLRVSGRYAYGLLKSEHGTHRLVRISPFDAEAMRHTSFANIEVVPDFGDVEDFDIPEAELRIDVFRSGGKGGQGVNTTDSAVRVVHVPTGITVVCQNERSQHQNKATALGIVKSKLYALKVQEQEAQTARERGEVKSAAWGNQIRSYVLHPYKMVKDHRTNFESAHPDKVLEGELKDFMKAYLEWMQGMK